MSAVFSLLKEAFKGFRQDRPMLLAASLSYYTLLSMAPLILLTVAAAGLVFGYEAVQGQIVEELRGLVGEAGAEVAQTVIANASSPAGSAVSIVIGILTLLFGATTVFVQLQEALDTIWDVERAPKSSALLGFLKDRLASLGMVLGIGFLLLVSLVISAALSAFGGWTSGAFGTAALLQVANVVTSLAVVTVLFAMIFKFLPDVSLRWRDVWFGAAVTAVLFTLGKFLIGLYLGRASIGSAYGAAGSVVVLMVWVYYSSLILFFGAELTQVRARRLRSRRSPIALARAGSG
jgi:membrane protein